ncbi:MAG: hypothetical protein PHF79_03545, partial [Candidatus Pacebacteria bacterium]|nr:hypothetical protein [Candidatus Paceibacterota bacterium]
MQKNKVVIVGKGGIGTYLSGYLTGKGFETAFFHVKTLSACLFPDFLQAQRPEAVFITISTRDKGEAARDYILACAEANIPVITCEKGAFAYHAQLLLPYRKQIGFSASAGGGTRMLPYIKSRHIGDKPVRISAVLNGTLNFIFDQIRSGSTFGGACKEAIRLGFAEPGAVGLLSLINGELKDVVMKICVMFNT